MFQEILSAPFEKKIQKNESSQDSSVGNALDWYSEGPGFKSRPLQLNFQFEKGYGRDSKQYAIKYGCVELNLSIMIIKATRCHQPLKNNTFQKLPTRHHL